MKVNTMYKIVTEQKNSTHDNFCAPKKLNKFVAMLQRNGHKILNIVEVVDHELHQLFAKPAQKHIPFNPFKKSYPY